MLSMSAAMLKLALLVLSIAVVITNTTATGRQNYRGEANRNNNDFENNGSFRANPRLEPAVIQINGRREVIDLQAPGLTGARVGARPGSGSMMRPAEDIISLELISGPPTFGFFLASRTDKRFISPTVNQNQPFVGDEVKEEREEEEEEEEDDNNNARILLRAADRLFYYTLDDPDNQAVTVFQNTKGSVRFNVMDYRIASEPRLWFPSLLRKELRVARWEFPRRQDITRLAVAYAPRGRRSMCQVTIIGAWIDDIRIGRPLRNPKAGVGGIVCFW